MTSTTAQQLQTLTRLASEGLSFDSTTIHPYSGAMTVEADRKTLVMINAAGEITFDSRPQPSRRNDHDHAADVNHYGADDAAPFPGATMHYSDPTTWPDHKVPAPTLQADGSIVTHSAADMTMLREIRQLLSDAPGSRTCSLQQDRESGDHCVQVSCGSDSTFSWVVNALNGAELNEHPTRRRTLQVFSIDHVEIRCSRCVEDGCSTCSHNA